MFPRVFQSSIQWLSSVVFGDVATKVYPVGSAATEGEAAVTQACQDLISAQIGEDGSSITKVDLLANVSVKEESKVEDPSKEVSRHEPPVMIKKYWARNSSVIKKNQWEWGLRQELEKGARKLYLAEIDVVKERKKVDALSSQLLVSRNETSQYKKEIRLLQEEKLSIMQKLVEANLIVSKEKKENVSNQQEVRALRKEAEKCRNDLSDAIMCKFREREEANGKLTELKGIILELNKVISQDQQEAELLRKEVEDYRLKLGQKDSIQANLLARKERAQDELVESKQTTSKLKQETERLQQEVQALRKEVEDCRRDLNNANLHFIDEKERVDQFERASVVAKEESTKIQQEVQQIRQDVESMRKDLELAKPYLTIRRMCALEKNDELPLEIETATKSKEERPPANLQSCYLSGQGERRPLRREITLASTKRKNRPEDQKDAWKPSYANKSKGTEQNLNPAQETAEIFKEFRSILNKLTPANIDRLLLRIKKLNINTEEKLVGVVQILFEKAIDEPLFSPSYAKMCNSLLEMEVPRLSANPADEKVKFRKLLLEKCEAEFKKDNDGDRKQSLGNIRFIGELFKLQIIPIHIVKYCISQLLTQSENEESLERLCTLMTTVGEELERSSVSIGPNGNINSYFSSMETIVRNDKLSHRARFMIQDVIDLRQNKWKPRRT